jgi:hypothetical protein
MARHIEAHDHTYHLSDLPNASVGLETIAAQPTQRDIWLMARDHRAGVSRPEATKLVQRGAAWVCLYGGMLYLHPRNESGLWDSRLNTAFDDVVHETYA